MYNKITNKDIEYFASFIPAERLVVGDNISPDFSHDELGGIEKAPDLLIYVLSTEEVSQIAKHCYENNLPLVVRGSGTGLVGSSVAYEGGVMIVTTQMNKVLELDKDNLTVTVQPGILLMELSEFVENNDLFYPPDPGEKSATIGGNISTNAGGMRAVKYGVTRDYVRGLTVVLPDGKIEKLGGKVVKNSSGYSLKDLVVGSEGTLAIVTEATLRLLPLPTKSISLLIPFMTMEAALEAVPEIIKSKANPTAIEYMSKETIIFAEDYLGKKFPDTKSDAYLLLTFDGNSLDSIEADYKKVADLCISLGAIDVYFIDTDERKKSVWSARGAFLEAIKASTDEMDECDVVVPRDKIADFIKYTHFISKELGIRIPSFGHAGDGNLHIYICRDGKEQKEWEEKLNKSFELMYNKASEFGGQVSGEHGIGFAKRIYLKEGLGEYQTELMKRIKSAFDPKGILNPGKIVY